MKTRINSNVNLTNDDKDLLRHMKNNYECLVRLDPKNGLYVLEGDPFEILSVISFVLIKGMENGIEMTNKKAKCLITVFNMIIKSLKEGLK